MPPARTRSSEMKQAKLSFTSMKRTDSGSKLKSGSSSGQNQAIVVDDSSSESEVEKPKKRKNLRKDEGASKEKEADMVQPPVIDEKPPPRPELNIKDPRWRALFAAARKQMNHLPPVHGEDKNKIHQILNVFDMNYDYGPCIGMTRLERWQRAHDMGLNPPPAIREILLTRQGIENTEYAQCALYGQV
ncbi:hypothetical protein VNI00_003055 [Paramarasmius palmivorus]|uniref:DNA polymerase delta subunit 4 n=1 Tax=Paramarasmius palmivorus TaxID=297713 RepID=A0AAW0DZD6_9AGAR